MSNDFLKILKERGYINDITDETGIIDLLDKKTPIVGYIGFDCTAPSLHVGSLMQIMLLRWFQRCGHKPIVLMGGATTKIGDPSGKDEARKLLSDEQIASNKAGIMKVFSKYLHFSGAQNDAIMLDNSEWLSNLNFIDFLRDFGKHFSVNKMLTFESVKARLDRQHHLSFLEFCYMLFQACDFFELKKRYNCTIQFGGSDQWGNIINGIDLTRKLGLGTVFGITTPLLTTSSGKKMGKSESGAVWLDSDMLSAYDYWQFWRNTEDADVINFLKLFTDLDLLEIAKLAQLEGQEINEAKIILADLATTMCHGEEASKQAKLTAQKTFSENQFGSELPQYEIEAAEIAEGIALYKLLVKINACESGKEAKRLIMQNAVQFNNKAISDPIRSLSAEDFEDNKIKVSIGKKRHIILSLTK